MAAQHKEQRLHWTKTNPTKSGWYWMLNPNDQPGLPTIVQIERDWESGRLTALIPPSCYPKQASRVVNVDSLDALWAGPLAIPSVASSRHRRILRFDGPSGIAA